ncbi:MAG: leucine-rich repeat protein, partial [Paludibacteraceae bacterium]|nr:leucine-rich repeat protein [Paludibacteraceae bacterium]
MNVQYSLDGTDWYPIPMSSGNGEFTSNETPPSDVIRLAKGEKVYVKGLYDGATFDGQNNVVFGMKGDIAVTGNVMSLIDGEGKATEIPTDYCFCALFRSCSGLTKAPELPAMELTTGCYLDMFYGCSKLTEAPALPATELQYDCYRSMFRDCKALKKAPDLMAFEMVTRCYYRMFDGCSNLNYIKVGTPDLRDGSGDWLIRGPSGSGTFMLPCGSVYTERGNSGIPENFTIEYFAVVVFMNGDKTELQRDTLACDELPVYRGKTPTLNGKTSMGWDKEIVPTSNPVEYYTAIYDPDLPEHCLCFTAEEAGSEIWYENVDNSPNVEYTTDGGYHWYPLVAGAKVTLPKVGDKVYFRGNNPNGFSRNANAGGDKYTSFKMTGRIAASGSVMSLIDGTGEEKKISNSYCFRDLFSGCESLVKAPELSATTLGYDSYYCMFKGCTNLTEAPELPATTLDNWCYESMFEGCTSLTKAPELPVTTLTDGCYSSMFKDCASLTEAPALPATTIGSNCYSNMFAGCVSLTKAPELPATTLDWDSYMKMFQGCISLTKAPELPATTLGKQCYSGMFAGCINLIEAPALPATELTDLCYVSMFDGCTSLTKAPELLATTWVYSCYSTMFRGCTSLNYIKVGVLSLDNDLGATDDWVLGVSGPGIFEFPCGSRYDKHGSSEVPNLFKIKASPIIIFQNPDGTELQRDTIDCGETPEYRGKTPTYGKNLQFKGWDKELDVIKEADVYYYTAVYEEIIPDLPVNCLCFTAEEDGAEVWYENKDNTPDVQYTTDGGYHWYPLEANVKVLLANKGDKVYVRGDNPTGFSHTNESYTSFKMEGNVAASGSVMSLIDKKGDVTEIPNANCFRALFNGCASLTQAPELPATTLKSNCYANMFGGCTSLTQAPELPATELAHSCYNYMFVDCSNLQEMPDLKATTMVPYCYFCMFVNCSSLTETKELPATELATDCYRGMFQGCKGLRQTTTLPATTLATNCYMDMFHDCVSLTKAPELPAMVLADRCYTNMFKGCFSLSDAPELPATELTIGCYYGMFNGCSKLIEAPVLPADKLVDECYYEMFKNCINLTLIEVGVLSLDNEVDATKDWVDGVDKEGLFIFPCGSRYDKHGVSEVPNLFKIKASPIIIFQNPDGTELQRDTIDCGETPEYRGKTPTYGKNLQFKGWDKELDVIKEADVYYYTAVYEEVVQDLPANCLCFTAEEAGSEIWYENQGINKPNVEYTIDGGYHWYPLEENNKVTLEKAGDKVYFRGLNGYGFSSGNADYSYFGMTGRIAASGSVMSLIDAKGETTKIPDSYCFYELFQNCESLTTAPELPATELEPFCYGYMFSGCKNIEIAPKLPATTLSVGCYSFMFNACSNITEAPELPATTLAIWCYRGMFSGCSNLTGAPELPVTTLADGCYGSMFQHCSSLTEAPKLPAKVLAGGCYTGMFLGCVALTEAPVLPAEKLVSQCYSAMFSRCVNLTRIEVGVLSLDNEVDATRDWVDGVDKEGLFIFPCGSRYDKHGVSEVPDLFKIKASPIIIFQNPDGTELQRDTINCGDTPEYRGKTPTYGKNLQFKGWDKELDVITEVDVYYYTAVYEEVVQDLPANCLCFTAEEAGSEIWYENYRDATPDVQYTVDGGYHWYPLDENNKVTLENVGDKVYFRGLNGDGFSSGNNGYSYFSMTGRIAASGSVMSLIDGEGTSAEIPSDSCFINLFKNCESLIQAPELTAATLTPGCYKGMFQGCTGLTKAPKLPAVELAPCCYESLFEGCSNLTEVPELPSTTMQERCYFHMFQHCTSLTEAPALPSVELAKSCYGNMFYGCTSLTKAPELPATTLAENCYGCMFDGCTSLTEAPELPAMTLANQCYWAMFYGCTSLTTAPKLPATELVFLCYYCMFENCTNLNYIEVGVKTLDGSHKGTMNWVKGVDGPGLFVFPCGSRYDKHGISEVPDLFKIKSSPIVIFQNPDGTELQRDTIDCGDTPEYRGKTPTYGKNLQFKGWDKELDVITEVDVYYYTAVYEEVGETNYLCFTAEEAASSISYKNVGNDPDVQYSFDGSTWYPLAENETVTLENVGDKVYFKGDNPTGFSKNANSYTRFVMKGTIAASGSVMSLIDGRGVVSEIPSTCCFLDLFLYCSALTKAPELTATVLNDSCYWSMFDNCTNLTEAPQLPVKDLTLNCYNKMFFKCTGLSRAPELPATTLAEGCYENMFFGCSRLTQAPELPATTMAKSCYKGMFSGCSRLEEAPELPAMTLAPSCYEGMFYQCSSLTEAPELPAEKLAKRCYSQMFGVCENLIKAPDLLAEKLEEECYYFMFERCSSLNYMRVGVLTLDNDVNATISWGLNVDGPGVFYFPCGSTYDKHGASEVPVNFEIISSPIVVFQNPDSTELQRDTLLCGLTPEYRGEIPTYGKNLEFVGWNPELQAHKEPGTYYYTAVYDAKATQYTLVDSVISACDSLLIEDRLFTESATWRDSIANEEGDSLIVIYHLQMSHSEARDSFLSACESFTHEGILYQEDAEWSDTLTAVSGCDSVINYHLTIHKGIEVDSTIVEEDEFFWKGQTYTADTLLTDTLQGAFGCDSIMKYHVIINKQSYYTLVDSVISACDSLLIEGRLFTESATWRDSIANEEGDSLIVIYHLQMSHSEARD